MKVEFTLFTSAYIFVMKMLDSRLVTILCGILFCFNLSAQVIYTNINDTILTFPEQTPGILDDLTNYFYFDLNQDGTDDFYFYAHYWEEWYSPSANEHPHWVLQLESIEGMGVPWFDGCAVDFGLLDSIRSETWLEYGLLYLDVVGYSTNCNLPFQDRYIGLRMEEGADYFYGWIRLDASHDTLIFKDFAYNSEANAIMLAGQTSPTGFSEINNVEEQSFYLVDKMLYFKDGNKVFQYCSITNLQGQKIGKYRIQNKQAINLNQLSSGIYIIVLEGKNQVSAMKIFVP